MKNVKIAVIGLVVLGIGWLFYEYKKIAGEAEDRVAKDVRWLMTGFEGQDQIESLSLQNKTHLETQLMVQGVNEHNRFVRAYHSLFIESGTRSCLLSEVIYHNREPSLQQQRWLESDESCLP
jgi:hypothetical protein